MQHPSSSATAARRHGILRTATMGSHGARDGVGARLHLMYFSRQWPDRFRSAAGIRSLGLLGALRRAFPSAALSCVSPARPHAPLVDHIRANLAATPIPCPINDTNAFETAIATAVSRSDAVVAAVFDGFLTEEMFSWRVAQALPGALRIVDTQDLHCLRQGRQHALLNRPGTTLDDLCDVANFMGPYLHELDAGVPAKDVFLREMAAIHRNDHALIVSPVELDLLVDGFGFRRSKFTMAPFFAEPPRLNPRPFHVRRHCCMIGNWRHAPNVDSVEFARDVIWPRLRTRLPAGTELHVYGANANRQQMELTRERDGFRIMGQCADQYATMSRYKVLLAPLRFGAGIKGKIVDAWMTATPVVTTGIGVEGMLGGPTGQWGGLSSNSPAEFVDLAADLYRDEGIWQRCVTTGRAILAESFTLDANAPAVVSLLDRYLRSDSLLRRERANDLMHQILASTAQSTSYYLSKYIEKGRSAHVTPNST